MSPLILKMMIGCAAAFVLQSAAYSANTINVDINGSGDGIPVRTVQQEINDFSNRYGYSVIIHGAVDLSAPISIAYSQGLNSDQAMAALSDAANAKPIRVYFVSPARGSYITDNIEAVNLVGDRGAIGLNLRRVSAAAAIESVAASDNAEVRFENGMPFGRVTLRARSMPLSQAVSYIASVTKTHWSLAYILEPGPPRPVVASQPTSGDSTVGGVQSAANLTNRGVQRDAKGNVLPIYVNMTPIVPPSNTSATTPTAAQINAAYAASQNAAAARQQQDAYYQMEQNIPGSNFGSIVAPDPSDQGEDFSDVRTYAPNGSGFNVTSGFGY